MVCIKTLERGPIAAAGEREGLLLLLLLSADMPEWGHKMGRGGVTSVWGTCWGRTITGGASVVAQTDRRQVWGRYNRLTSQSAPSVVWGIRPRWFGWCRSGHISFRDTQQPGIDQNTRFCVVYHVLRLRRQWEFYLSFVLCVLSHLAVGRLLKVWLLIGADRRPGAGCECWAKAGRTNTPAFVAGCLWRRQTQWCSERLQESFHMKGCAHFFFLSREDHL